MYSTDIVYLFPSQSILYIKNKIIQLYQLIYSYCDYRLY